MGPNVPIDDPVRPDSAAHYKTLIVPSVLLVVETPTTPEPTTYFIEGRHQFWLVRGDAAVLVAGQEARSDRWYLYRWDDQTQPSGSLVAPFTWGKLKAVYRGSGVVSTASKSWGAVKALYK